MLVFVINKNRFLTKEIGMSVSKRASKSSKRSTYVDTAKFVQTWITSSTVLEVSKKLGMSYPNVRVRANNLINRQVQLPKLPSGVGQQGRHKLDVDSLNAMIKEVLHSKVGTN